MSLPFVGFSAPQLQEPLQEPASLWTLTEGLKNPESVVYDAVTKSFYVSNVNGEGGAKDGNGYITQVDESGKLKKAEWVKGLNAPKGLALKGNTLWAADIDEIVEIDVKAAKIVKKISVPGAVFLNDVAASESGTVFVSDTLGNQIYKYDGKTATPLTSKDNLESPNGLYVDGDHLVVASWGAIKSFSEKPKVAGKLFTVSFDGSAKKAVSKSFGNLDGLEKVKDSFVVSDWVSGKIYKVSSKGKVQVISLGKQGTADLNVVTGADGTTLVVVPQMMENKLTAFKL